MWGGGRRRRGGWRGRGPWGYQALPANIEYILAVISSAQTEPRRTILNAIGDRGATTNQIYQTLLEKDYNIPRTTLYYHLSELENLGLITHTGYKESGAGAPEKVWELRKRKICIDILTGETFDSD
ncbi:MAG: winged helix-turn-helix domain-containing protein [Desulfurococcales archaeon]|nr:winged helix-turn-helix domain-containing protein [Desulfurococcales archaeon]